MNSLLKAYWYFVFNLTRTKITYNCISESLKYY